MSKFIKWLLGIVVVLTIFLTQCDKGGGIVYKSAEDSKENEVFICEYEIDKKSFQINDTLMVVLEEVWLEKCAFHTKNFFVKRISDKTIQLVFKFEEKFKFDSRNELFFIDDVQKIEKLTNGTARNYIFIVFKSDSYIPNEWLLIKNKTPLGFRREFESVIDTIRLKKLNRLTTLKSRSN